MLHYTLKLSLLFFTLNLLFSCGSHKNTTPIVGIAVDSTWQDDGWETEEATFDDDMEEEKMSKGKLFLNNSDKVKTILLYAGDSEMNAPIIHLNSEEKLTLKFDLLDMDNMNLSYRIVHCNALWTPSDIFETDFISGINNTPIRDVQLSTNTTTSYIHHTAYIPEAGNDILLSGNYLAQVFHTSNPDSLLFQKPFYVVNQQVSVSANMVAPRINEAKAYMQNLQFTIEHPSYDISNPYNDVFVSIVQNQQQYLIKEGLRPAFVQDKQMVYNYDEPTYFEGGNEFRFIDLKSMNYQTPEIASMEFDGELNHAYLTPQEKRTFKIYSSQADINGRFIIKNDEGLDPHVDGDYVLTHFKLKFDHDFPGSDIYVAGGFSHNQLLEENKLTYNHEQQMYEGSILLKQGYYNYQFVTKYQKENNIELAYVEGSHDETENDYGIFVYHKNVSLNTHELIGFQRLNSIK